jgi:hypothetical protein
LQKEFSIDWELYAVVACEFRLATLHELQTLYNTEDLYFFLEIIEARGEFDHVARLLAEQEAASRK